MNQLILANPNAQPLAHGYAINTLAPMAPALGVVNQQTTTYWHFLHAHDELSRAFELIKVLRQHQSNNRWTLLVAPQHIPDKALLNCCSVDMSHVLIVREKQIPSMVETLESALKHHTCGAIVAWCDKWHKHLSASKLAHLTTLAAQAQCHVYAFNKQLTHKQAVVEH